jgi:hypothetical protein
MGRSLYFCFSTHTKNAFWVNYVCRQKNCYALPQNLIHWRDSNPGVLFPRRMCDVHCATPPGLDGSIVSYALFCLYTPPSVSNPSQAGGPGEGLPEKASLNEAEQRPFFRWKFLQDCTSETIKARPF